MERCRAGRVRDSHLGWMASPYHPVPAGWDVSAEPAAGLGGERCPRSRAPRCTGWCGKDIRLGEDFIQCVEGTGKESKVDLIGAPQ